MKIKVVNKTDKETKLNELHFYYFDKKTKEWEEINTNSDNISEFHTKVLGVKIPTLESGIFAERSSVFYYGEHREVIRFQKSLNASLPRNEIESILKDRVLEVKAWIASISAENAKKSFEIVIIL